MKKLINLKNLINIRNLIIVVLCITIISLGIGFAFLSVELEKEYMNKFVGSVVSFIPEIKKDDYLIGHSGNYLLIKCKGDELHHDSVPVMIDSIDYPYCGGKVLKK